MAAFTTLSEVKRHLDMSSSANDDELQDMIDAATERVRALVGSFDAVAVTDRVAAHGGTVLLSRRPVVGPVLVNGFAVDESLINREAGLLYGVPYPMPLTSMYGLTVTYSAGGGVVPASVSLATAIVAAHLWQTQRGAAPSPLAVADQGFDDNLPAQSGQGYALPNRARELLEPFIHESQVA